MASVDLSSSQRIPRMIELLTEMSRIKDPTELQRRFASGIRALYHTGGYISLSVRDLPSGWYRVTRVALEHRPPPEWTDNWKNPNAMPLYTGGFLGSIIADESPKILHHLDIRDDPVLGDALLGIGSAMAFPLFDSGKALNWGVLLREAPEAFTPEEMETQLMRGNLIGGMVRNLVNIRRINELNATLNEQMEQVANIQRSLIPQRLPEIAGVDLAASYVTSNQAGGDYYDFFDMGRGDWGVLIADVSGHGAGAATVMAMLQTILHDYQDRHKGPGAMLAHANRSLLKKNLDGSFVTAFMGVLSADRRRMTFANAGHLHPAVRGKDRAVREIVGVGGLPLGIVDDAEYATEAAALSPGESAVLYTDGITEAFSPPPERQMFGSGRLRSSIGSTAGDPASLIDAIHSDLFEHTQTMNREDDQTIVALKVRE